MFEKHGQTAVPHGQASKQGENRRANGTEITLKQRPGLRQRAVRQETEKAERL